MLAVCTIYHVKSFPLRKKNIEIMGGENQDKMSPKRRSATKMGFDSVSVKGSKLVSSIKLPNNKQAMKKQLNKQGMS